MSRLWGYVLAGASLFTAGVLFVCSVFGAGKRAERAKRAEARLKRKEANEKTFKKLEEKHEKFQKKNDLECARKSFLSN